jgi:poly(A) polymerase
MWWQVLLLLRLEKKAGANARTSAPLRTGRVMAERSAADVHNRSRNRKQDRRLPSPLLQLNENEDDEQKASTTKKHKFEIVIDEDLDHNRHHQRLSESLYKLCTDRLHLVESSEGKRKRRMVLRDLRELLSTWSASLPVDDDDNKVDNDGVPPSLPSPALLSFGSYRLGVHSPDADVDCLVLAPPHIKREDFFGSWVDNLNQMTMTTTMRTNGDEAGGRRICNLHSIPNAYTPVIKFEMDGVKIDMIFASINNRKLFAINRLHTDNDNHNNDIDSPSNDMDTDETMRIDDAMLAGLDESSVRSINGVRVAQYLLDTLTEGCANDGCLPPPMRDDATSCCLDKFRLTLRLVKAWARNHGLYANVLGFLGGVNWAILVCYICVRHPNELPSRLLQIFFHTFANWSWPDPVSLSKQQNDPPLGVQPLPSWDPINIYRDSTHLMPIITPCYPSMNSSYNVGEPQLRRMRYELLKASKLCDTIMNDIASSISVSCWDVLFEGNDFFKQHANYLQVCSCVDSFNYDN